MLFDFNILYKTGYINKKICIYDIVKHIIYFGGDDFINKNIKKSNFYANDTFKQIITNNSIYNINKTIYFMDLLSYSAFNLNIVKILFGDHNNNYN